MPFPQEIADGLAAAMVQIPLGDEDPEQAQLESDAVNASFYGVLESFSDEQLEWVLSAFHNISTSGTTAQARAAFYQGMTDAVQWQRKSRPPEA